MSQESPAKEEEEVALETADEAPPQESAIDPDTLQSVSAAVESIQDTALVSTAIDDIQPLVDDLQAIQETLAKVEPNHFEDIDGPINPEVADAVNRINTAEEGTSYDKPAQEPAAVTENIDNLYDGDRLTAMRELLEEHNLRIVQQLIASDSGALSPAEVAFRNTGIISESTVRDHLRNLADNGFVTKLEPDVETVPNELPRTYYAATPTAIELLKQMGLWENLGMLYQLYNSLDRPEEIQQIENWDHRPEPDWL